MTKFTLVPDFFNYNIQGKLIKKFLNGLQTIHLFKVTED